MHTIYMIIIYDWRFYTCIHSHKIYTDTRDKYDNIVVFLSSDFIIICFCACVFYKLASRKPKYDAKNECIDLA